MQRLITIKIHNNYELITIKRDTITNDQYIKPKTEQQFIAINFQLHV
jgi:hypothetical protein